jgi:hypothetical protein
MTPPGAPGASAKVADEAPVAAVPLPGPEAAGSARGALRHASTLRFGLIGQALTFVAMLVPILMREGHQIAILVFTSAIASALVSTALLGYQLVYPVIRGPRAAAVATRLSITALTMTSLLIVPFTLVEDQLGFPAGTFAAAAAMLFTMGLYLLTVTQLVRADDTSGIGLVRLLYGVTLLVLTGVVSVWHGSDLGLTLASAAAYVVPTLYVATRRRATGPESPQLTRAARRRLRRAILRRSSRPTFSTLADGWAFFLPGIALPGLGIAQNPWAIVTRICGGFSTVLLTIVAPPLEARLAKAVRDRDGADYWQARRVALAVGAAFSVTALCTGLALAVYVERDSLGSWMGPVALAGALYFVVLLTMQPINRTPSFVGRHGARLVWDIARAALVTVAFLMTDGIERLIAIGAVLSVFGLLLIPLSRYRTTTQP